MPRLVRSNDDPKVLADLDLLAREYGSRTAGDVLVEEAPRESERAMVAAAPAPAAADDDAPGAEPGPLDDPFVRTFVRTSYHLRRYFPYYLGAAAWVLVMLLMSPVGNGTDEEPSEFAGPSAAFSEANQTVESAFNEVPAAPDFTSATQGTSDFLAIAAADDFEPAVDTSSDTGDVDFEGDFDDPSLSSDTTITFEATPQPLRIVRTAYSSRAAGTPFEQDPAGGGLPVAAAAGQSSKRSFIALTGDETILRRKLVEDAGANVGAEAATVRACPIVTEGWAPTRGAAFDSAEEPDFAGPCVAAVVGEDGIWAWDLSSFAKPGESAGFALTTTAAEVSATFSLVFEPKVVLA